MSCPGLLCMKEARQFHWDDGLPPEGPGEGFRKQQMFSRCRESARKGILTQMLFCETSTWNLSQSCRYRADTFDASVAVYRWF